MNKKLTITAIASLMVACSYTKDEQEILDLFIGNGSSVSSPKVTEYESYKVKSNVYLEDFSADAPQQVVTWNTSNGGSASNQNGKYVITASGSAPKGVWIEYGTLVTGYSNYQIEVTLRPETFPSGSEQGLVFDIYDSGSAYGYFVFSTYEEHELLIGYFDNKTTHWYAGDNAMNSSGEYLFTIRCIGSRVYFFLDRKYLAMRDYKTFRNIGFYVGQGGTLTADNLRIDLIE